jgi:DNA polymerase III epsilon subunit-like protein
MQREHRLTSRFPPPPPKKSHPCGGFLFGVYDDLNPRPRECVVGIQRLTGITPEMVAGQPLFDPID